MTRPADSNSLLMWSVPRSTPFTVSSRTAIKAGAKVVVHAQATVTKPVKLVATEIILMPSNTTFVG
jgi:hypothetical protein